MKITKHARDVKNDMSNIRKRFFSSSSFIYSFYFQSHKRLDFCILSDSVALFMLLKVIGCDGAAMKRLFFNSFSGSVSPQNCDPFDQRCSKVGHPTVIRLSCRT